MIIRATFNDNDYSTILELFFDRFKFVNYNLSYRDEQNLKVYRDKSIESDDLLQKAIFYPKQMTADEKIKFVSYIKDSILVYINSNSNSKSSYDYLKDRLRVDIVDNYTDDDENGEVAYYFITADTVIII